MLKKIASFCIASGIVFAGLGASAATFSINEPLDTPGPLSSPWVISGTGYTPIVVNDGAQTPANALRLTDDGTGRSGFALFDKAISSSKGIDITFKQAQYGGTGADGIVFFVKKGNDNSTTPGDTGGALGYTNLSGALLGVGIDAWGNFASEDVDGTGCSTTFTRSEGGGNANAITLRGAGQGGSGYCMLADSVNVTSLSLPAISSVTNADRASAARTIRVVIDPSTASNPKVAVYYEGTKVTEIALPNEFKSVKSIKVGFASGTGGSVDFHEVWGITSKESPNAPKLADTGSDVAGLGLLAVGLVAAGASVLVRRRA